MASFIRQIVNRLTGLATPSTGGRPPAGWTTGPRRRDFDPFAGDMNAERIVGLLRMAARGQPEQMDALFDEMLARDDALRNARRTRRIAVTGLPWEIVPATQANRAGKLDPAQAEEIAAACREMLDGLEGFDSALAHLADAVGRGTAVCEALYDRAQGRVRPVAIGNVSFRQLRTDSQDPWRLRIVQDGDSRGLAVDEQPEGKFIVHTPDSVGGSFFCGLLTVSVVGYLLKRTSKGGLSIGIETFGLPLTVAKYGPSATENDKAEALRLIDELSTNRGGVFPESIVVELKERILSGRWPHHDINEMVDNGYALAWLGQTGTTTMQAAGLGSSQAQVQNEVREDIRADDIARLSDTIRRQLLRPFVLQNYGAGAGAYAPVYRSVVEEPKDLTAQAGLLSTIVNDLGADVPLSVIPDELGVKLVEGTDLKAAIPGRAVAPSAFGFGGGDAFGAQPGAAAVQNSRRLIAKARLRQIAGGNVLAGLAAWISASVLASQGHTAQVLAAVTPHVEQVHTSGDVDRVLSAAFAALPIADMVELERQYFLAGRLAGMDAARLKIEGRRDRGTKGRRANLLGTGHWAPGTRAVANADAPLVDFARLPFTEAIDAFKTRLNLDPETFLTLDAQARSRAFRVAGVWNMQLLSGIADELTKSIAAGETQRDFRLRLPDMADAKGWSGEKPWHASVVQFQNFAMATAAGSYGQMRSAGVGHWRFIAAESACELCVPLADTVFLLSDRTYYPPLHFNCRCEADPVFDDEVDEGNVARAQDVPAEAIDRYRADPNAFMFDPAQYAKLEPLDLSTLPAGLRGAFEEFARAHNWEIAA